MTRQTEGNRLDQRKLDRRDRFADLAELEKMREQERARIPLQKVEAIRDHIKHLYGAWHRDQGNDELKKIVFRAFNETERMLRQARNSLGTQGLIKAEFLKKKKKE